MKQIAHIGKHEAASLQDKTSLKNIFNGYECASVLIRYQMHHRSKNGELRLHAKQMRDKRAMESSLHKMINADKFHSSYDLQKTMKSNSAGISCE